jgi:hypothetical protein
MGETPVPPIPHLVGREFHLFLFLQLTQKDSEASKQAIFAAET